MDTLEKLSQNAFLEELKKKSLPYTEQSLNKTVGLKILEMFSKEEFVRIMMDNILRINEIIDMFSIKRIVSYNDDDLVIIIKKIFDKDKIFYSSEMDLKPYVIQYEKDNKFRPKQINKISVKDDYYYKGRYFKCRIKHWEDCFERESDYMDI